MENIDIDIDKDNLKNIDIDIDMAILENIDIDIDKGILQNIDIDKISYRLGFGISNTPSPHSLKVKVEDREYTVSTDLAEWSAVERYKSRKRNHSLVGPQLVGPQVHKHVRTSVNSNT